MSNYYDNWGIPNTGIKPALPRDDTLMCIICKRPITDEQSYSLLPYGSRYDDECVCGGCCGKHFDPVIDKAVSDDRR